MRGISTVIARLAVAAVLGAVLGLATGVASATNFGSGINAECDEQISSQCVADNGTHTVYFTLAAGSQMIVATETAISTYHAVADVTAAKTTNSQTADVWVGEADYGNTSWWAYGSCWITATYGGADPDRWCKPQVIRYNRSHPSNWDSSTNGRKAIACHELGHTLGLRHAPSTSASCMKLTTTTDISLTTHDKNLLTGQYP